MCYICNNFYCSSYYFKVEGTWTVNDVSGWGDVVYSGGFAQSTSPLFQSIADEIGVLRGKYAALKSIEFLFRAFY